MRISGAQFKKILRLCIILRVSKVRNICEEGELFREFTKMKAVQAYFAYLRISSATDTDSVKCCNVAQLCAFGFETLNMLCYLRLKCVNCGTVRDSINCTHDNL